MTLFERVTYGGDAQGVKISVHMIQSLMSELASSRLSLSDVVSVLDLDQGQSNDFSVVLSRAMQASNPQDFASKVFGYLILANNTNRDKSGTLDAYLIESNFWRMVDTEALK
jgi:hypothetical protein